MIKPPFRIGSFPSDEDGWRIDWLGEIAYPNRGNRWRHPSVRVSLSRCWPTATSLGSGLRPPAAGPIVPTPEQVHRWVSVGVIMVLRIGDIWRDRMLADRAPDEPEVFRDLRIEPETTTLLKAGSSTVAGDQFLLPLAQHPWHLEAGTHSYCLRVAIDERRSMVVPCLELVRFYFGSSGSLLHRLFGATLTRRDLYTVARRDIGGKLYLELASGVSRVSAADIGRIALSNDAWASASLVSGSCMRASVRREPIFPMARFPFVGQTDLAVRGKWIGNADGTRTFVVFAIEACTHAFPFTSLVARAIPTREDGDETATEQPAANRNRKDPNWTELVEQDASTELARADVWVRTGRNFRDLDHKRVVSSFTVRQKSADASGGCSDALTAHAVGEPGSSEAVRALEIEDAEERKAIDELPRYFQVVLRTLESMPEVVSTVLTGNLAKTPNTALTADAMDVDVGVEDEDGVRTSGGFVGPQEDGWTSALSELQKEFQPEVAQGADPHQRVLGVRLDGAGRCAVLTAVEAQTPCFSLMSVDPDAFEGHFEVVAHQARVLALSGEGIGQVAPEADVAAGLPLDLDTFRAHLRARLDALVEIEPG